VNVLFIFFISCLQISWTAGTGKGMFLNVENIFCGLPGGLKSALPKDTAAGGICACLRFPCIILCGGKAKGRETHKEEKSGLCFAYGSLSQRARRRKVMMITRKIKEYRRHQ
jgi:hypothetical protein